MNRFCTDHMMHSCWQEAYRNSFARPHNTSLDFTAIYLPRLFFPLLARLQYILSKNAFIRRCTI